MPHTISELLEGKPDTLTATLTDKATIALGHMARHDYSQLPVVDAAKIVRGLITYESIMRAMQRFNCALQNLQVSAAMVKAEKRSPDDDLSDVLPVMERTGSVLIVDADDRLLGIVTSYDVMEYYRARAENMMLVEDIESMVRDLILYAFYDDAGGTDQAKLEAAIKGIDSQRDTLKKQFRKGIAHYLQSGVSADAKLNAVLANQSFEVMAPEQPAKEFEQLALSEFIDLLCSKDRWTALYKPIFGLDAAHVRSVLDQVRLIRNGLAHFRHDVTSEEHEHLRFCADWLSNHLPGIPVSWPVSGEVAVNVAAVAEAAVAEGAGAAAAPAPTEVEPGPTPDPAEILDEVIDPGESRYARLAVWLSQRHGRTKEVQLKFDDIESIIGSELPPSARAHRAWWANDTVTHVQSKQWLDAGWRVSYLNLTEQRVTFVRTRGRESAYIAFFSRLLEKVRQDGRTPIRTSSPDGENWINLTALPVEGRNVAWLTASFARGARFRVDLYIDTGDQEWNKRAFDRLRAHAAQIEAQVGEPLSWERLDAARASRIACYGAGSIMDAGNHDELQDWAVEMLARFNQVIAPAAVKALEEARS